MSELKLILENNPQKKKQIFKIIGEKIAKSRKSSRKKLKGISKKLNLSEEALKDIESGNLENFPQTILITGFIRAFAEKVDCDINAELNELSLDKDLLEEKKIPKFVPKNYFFLFLIIIFLISLISFVSAQKKISSKKDKVENSFYSIENDFPKKAFKLSNKLNINKNQDTEKITENINSYEKKNSKVFFEISFLEETWMEILDKQNVVLESGLFQVGQFLRFEFKQADSDFFIKSGNLGGFQIFYKDEFFAPFGLSGQATNGFFFKEKINSVKNIRVLKNEY